MNIFILSVGQHIYSTNRIYREASRRGHKVSVINHAQCFIKISEGKRQIIYEGKNIATIPDVIIPRIGNSIGKHGAAIVKEFEANGVYTTASSLGIEVAQDKVKSLQEASIAGIKVPNSIFSIDPSSIDEQIQAIGGAPIIIKLQEGTQGVGVILAETKKSAKSIIDAFYELGNKFMLQEFVEESKGEDVRAFVVGNKVVAAMKRTGSKDEFRSNIHRGGKGEKVTLTNEETAIALKVSKAFNLDVAGVDIIKSKRGPLLLEINGTPGLQGIEAYTKVNVALEIVKYLEKNVQ